MRICKVKATKRIIEMQSAATEGTLIKNAINAGYAADAIEELEVDAIGYAAAKAEDPVEIAAEQAKAANIAREAAKKQAIIDNLPSWAQVNQAVTNIANLDDAKAFIRKLARLVYWMARDKQD